MVEEINYESCTEEYLKQLPKGVFLTVKDKNGKANTMTVGWGTIGYMWKKPVLMVMVRKSRYTYGLLEEANKFTISVPLNREMQKELLDCGRNSGRDIDKFGEFEITAKSAQSLLETPIIAECDLHFECKVLYKQEMDPDNLNEAIKNASYVNGDYHVLYYGEIIECYKTV